jgi:hypothetical protein
MSLQTNILFNNRIRFDHWFYLLRISNHHRIAVSFATLAIWNASKWLSVSCIIFIPLLLSTSWFCIRLISISVFSGSASRCISVTLTFEFLRDEWNYVFRFHIINGNDISDKSVKNLKTILYH